jgi:PleD family two-component response regulator
MTRLRAADRPNTQRTIFCPPTIQSSVIAHPNDSGHILVADDYLTNQQVAYMHLTAAGFSVDLADNGQQAVEAFVREPAMISF